MLNNPDKYYKAFFCEENCWQLLNSLPKKLRSQFYVLFLTNPDKSMALQNQRAAPKNEIVIWDYHVILFNSKEKLVYDMDSRLAFPEEIQNYIYKTFPNQNSIPQEFKSFIRPVEANLFLERFSSDRHHMLDHNGLALQEFPDWPCITSSEPITLSEFLSFKETTKSLAPFLCPQELLNL